MSFFFAPFGDLDYKQKQDVESFFIFLFYCKHKNSSTVQRSLDVAHGIHSCRGSKTRPFLKLHTTPPCTVCFPRSPKLFTEILMRQLLGWHCPVIPVPLSQRDEEKPRHNLPTTPHAKACKSHDRVVTLRSQFLFKSQVTKGKQKSSCQYFFAMTTGFWVRLPRIKEGAAVTQLKSQICNSDGIKQLNRKRTREVEAPGGLRSKHKKHRKHERDWS